MAGGISLSTFCNSVMKVLKHEGNISTNYFRSLNVNNNELFDTVLREQLSLFLCCAVEWRQNRRGVGGVAKSVVPT